MLARHWIFQTVEDGDMQSRITISDVPICVVMV